MMLVVQFSTERRLMSWLIRWATWSDYSHVDVVLPAGHPFAGFLLGARHIGGVQVRPPTYANFRKVLRLQTEMPDAILDFLHQQVGKPYDFKALVGYALREDWRDPLRWFCSELVEGAAEAVASPLLRTAEIDRVSPRDLSLSPRWGPA